MVEILLSAAASFATVWLWRLLHLISDRRLPVTVTIDAKHPRAKIIAGYLAEIAARLDERPESMQVTFKSPGGVSLDLERDSRLVIHVTGQHPAKLDLRRRWIADHPVPIQLKGLVLYINPVDSNRFRVNNRRPIMIPPWTAIPLSLAASAGLMLAMPWLTGLAIGSALGMTTVALTCGRRR